MGKRLKFSRIPSEFVENPSMVRETTWNRSEQSQKNFDWKARDGGIEITHPSTETSKGSSYIIPWEVYQKVKDYAREKATGNPPKIKAGCDQEYPLKGSVGEWVLTADLKISKGILTPRHLCFLGPIYGRVGFVQPSHEGNAIIWEFIE